MNKFNIFYVATYALLTMGSCVSINKEVTPINLRTEYLVEPIGLDAKRPRFTWEYEAKKKDFSVSKSEIRIGTSPDNLEVYNDNYDIRPETRYYWTVTIWDDKGNPSETSKMASFETGKMDIKEWKAKWITDSNDKEIESAPLFRKTIKIDKTIKDAKLYISSAGYYEFFINGKRVGENYLDPGYTHFDKRNLYVTHDIMSLLNSGDNVLTAVLGNGWYNEQSVATWNFHKARWRDRPRMIAEAKIVFDDGTQEIICTDESWKTNIGAYTYNNLYSGDNYDARLEEKGWKENGFNDASWKNAMVTEEPSPILKAQQMPGIRIDEELRPSEVHKFNDQLYVFKFDKNFTGFCRLKVKGEPGTQITIKHGELLKKDGRLEQGNINVYYYPEKPGEIFQTDKFILTGEGEEVFMPSFTYHGFQYVEIETTKPVQLTEQNLTGVFIHTDLTPVGSFSCSNPLLNRIWDATMEAYKSNIHSIPTDCPQREKNGWTADAHVAVDLGLLGFDGITLYEKWMEDFIDNQRDSIDDISPIIPSSGWGFDSKIGPVWDAAMFLIPNTLYNYYGDSRSIEKLYPTLERYLGYLQRQEDKDGYINFGLGDWVFWKATTNNTYTSTSYYYLQNELMGKFAKLLGKDSTPYATKASDLKKKINDKFFDPQTGVYAEGTQAAQALALYLEIVPEGKESMVAKSLVDSIRANNHFLDFGLIGSKTVPAMLTKYGYIEDAMKMITKTDAPSWGYWIQQGYTTLPETWTISPEFRDASLNHVFLGDVSAWMMNQLVGINYDPAHPGFENILITPHFVSGIDWAKGQYHSVKGMIKSSWKKVGDKITLNVEVPAGVKATVIVDGKSTTLHGGEHTLTYNKK